MSGTILVTGASGYVGGHIVSAALTRGYSVRVVARTASSASTAISKFPSFESKLSSAIVPDITSVDAFAGAGIFDGVVGIIHTASPFVLNPEDNVKELLEPAINGSVAILEAAKRWGKDVKTVVATSSFASINDVLKGKREGYKYDEKDWNPMTFEEASTAPGVVAYCASKALAEKAMWDWVRDNSPAFTLTTICPPWVFGPYHYDLQDTKKLSESLGLLNGLIGASTLPDFDFGGFADVREVAEAHLLALEKPEAAGQRFLVGQEFRYQRVVDTVRAAFPELKDRVPAGTPGYKEPAYEVDGSKVGEVLGLKYRSLEETMIDTFKQLLAARKIEGTV
ncbi:hypothetical protein S7711_03509 [Stachybotrys chartarum IBT 7711]|uniref:Ketoreductase domain-containing protein n=1 Tax=Stachybotrys chartarum (strain CBS 109288 / IBT 7711) TaxID=1280523 RepID=A0A084AFZ3_STACB|nr:hypothetical protein S7711_03509 [Stachybotrys chartarum IBT 7711]